MAGRQLAREQGRFRRQAGELAHLRLQTGGVERLVRRRGLARRERCGGCEHQRAMADGHARL
jgi:hypothetical protein